MLSYISYIFRNDVQILLVRADLSGWFSLSVVPFSYVIGVGCSVRSQNRAKVGQPTPTTQLNGTTESENQPDKSARTNRI